MGTGWRRKVTPWARGIFFAQAALLVGVTAGLGGNATSIAVDAAEAPVTQVLGAQETRSAPVPSAATPSTSTSSSTTSPSPPPTAPPLTPPSTVVALPAPAVTTTCADALAYLAAHQAPGFVDSCADGSAFGHYGVTCWNTAGMCPNGAKIIRIACPAPFVYMNEAHNSWTLIGQGSGIDTYGQGTAAEQAWCNSRR